jgi:hypothetical protein
VYNADKMRNETPFQENHEHDQSSQFHEFGALLLEMSGSCDRDTAAIYTVATETTSMVPSYYHTSRELPRRFPL